MSATLWRPAAEWADAFLAMARECQHHGDARYVQAIEDFPGYLQRLEIKETGIGLEPELVTGSIFWLVSNGEIVGCSRLRHRLTPALEREGGHIGYDIRPTQRRKGFGTLILKLTLIEARARGIERVRVTCDTDNIGSVRIIEKNGGALAGQCISDQSGREVSQYWIDPIDPKPSG